MHNRTVLLVEDNPDDEALTIRAMTHNNINNKIVVARDGVQALDCLFGQNAAPALAPAPLPHLILLDLKLPRVDGLEVLRRIRSHDRTRFLPVVIFTSSGETNDLTECYRLGANAYVKKPVNSDEFSDAVKSLARFWLQVNENPPERNA